MNERERIMDPGAVGGQSLTEGQAAWKNDKTVWGRTEPIPPGWAMSATRHHDNGACEYRDLDSSDAGWPDIEEDLDCGSLWKVMKV